MLDINSLAPHCKVLVDFNNLIEIRGTLQEQNHETLQLNSSCKIISGPNHKMSKNFEMTHQHCQ